MNSRTMTPFQQALETVESLSREDQEELLSVIHRRLVERRRTGIAHNAQETVREGEAHYGNPEDLRRDLLENDLLYESVLIGIDTHDKVIEAKP
ncbi:hypothetical protein GF380_05540 [Candidatus Uhrbacteria bacterium]|nr:hypothetical protein [Candidatus Uhrbacteria bacterium]